MQRYFSKIKNDNILILNEDDLYHIKVVMRMQKDDLVEVVYDNNLYICKLNSLFEAEIVRCENNNIIKNTYKVLCVPLLPDSKFSFVLQKATELAVDEIIPVETERSKVKILDVDKKLNRWQKICKEAAEQSKRLDIPKINTIKKISELNISGTKILCSTKQNISSIKKVIQNIKNCDKIVMMIGPEGGLSNSEEMLLISLGFIPVTIGSNILRVETVPIYLLSVLNYEMME